MRYKSGFSLMEILVSIAIFSIVIIFLYQTLEITEKSNNFYSDKLVKKQRENDIKEILFLDLIHKKGLEKISNDKNENNIIKFKSTNTFHNPFFENITYLVSRKKNLLRIQSKKEFNQNQLTDNFFNNSYIDIIDNNITKFKVKTQKDKKIVFYIKKDNKKVIIFSF
jgi:prepilin-type N-terminal cleavage/methylation domain-containing protein